MRALATSASATPPRFDNLICCLEFLAAEAERAGPGEHPGDHPARCSGDRPDAEASSGRKPAPQHGHPASVQAARPLLPDRRPAGRSSRLSASSRRSTGRRWPPMPSSTLYAAHPGVTVRRMGGVSRRSRPAAGRRGPPAAVRRSLQRRGEIAKPPSRLPGRGHRR